MDRRRHRSVGRTRRRRRRVRDAAMEEALSGVVGQSVRSRRKKGVSVPLVARAMIALAACSGATTQREIATQYGVSTSTVTRFAQTAKRVRARRRNWPAGELRRELQQELREKARGGRRVDAVLSAVRHGPFVRKLYEERATIYLDEVRDALGRRFGRSRGRPGAVSRSTLCRFVKHRLGLSRRRSCAGVTGDNLRRRRETWFDKYVESSSSWYARRARGSAKMADAPTWCLTTPNLLRRRDRCQ